MPNRRPAILTLIILLTCAYGGALIVSSAHLRQVYLLFDNSLPHWVSLGLAIALESVAFLLSLISTSLGTTAGPWPGRGSTAALLLVWSGNGYSMFLAAPDQPWYVTLLATCFVPICTLMVGKVLGALFRMVEDIGQQEVAEKKAVLNRQQQSRLQAGAHHRTPEFQQVQSLQPATEPQNLTDLEPTEMLRTTAPDGEQILSELLHPPRPVLSSISLEPSVTVSDRHLVTSQAGTKQNAETLRLNPDTQQNRHQQRRKAGEIPVPESTSGLESPGRIDIAPTRPRKVTLDVTGIGIVSDEALERIGLNRSELDRLTQIVNARWPKSGTPRRLSAEQGVLAWIYAGAGASKTRMAQELGIGKKEWIVRDIIRSVQAVMQAAGELE